ncbi:MAG: glycosyltransferase family 39 protein [Solirubrobacterales bacterium]
MNLWLPLAALLLGLPFAGLFAWLTDPAGRLKLGAREGLAWSAVGWAVFSVAVLELLSLGAGHDLASHTGHISRRPLVAVWLLPALAGAAICVAKRGAFTAHFARARAGWAQCSRFERALLIVIALCALTIGAVGLLTAPNTWDSMTYHLARVAAWLQLGGVHHYATNAEPQLFQPPGAEMLIAQLQAITRGDRMAASVQWVAYLLSVSTVSLIAARLRTGRGGQIIAAALAATAPMALLEGTSTQNDLVVSLWLLIAGLLALQIAQRQQLAFGRILVACAAIGLAVLTKGTALLFAPPIVALLAYATVRRAGWARAVAFGAAGLLIVVALNAGQWQRNHETYGKYIYSGSGVFDYSNDRFTPQDLFSNVVRNAALYAGTPSARANEPATDAVRGTLKLFGVDPDDPRTTFPGQSFVVPKSGPDENHGASPLLFLLTAWAIGLVLLAAAYRSRTRTAWALIVVAQIALFCLAIKWQPWHVRLHLPFVLAGIPLVAVCLDQIKRRWFSVAAVSIACIAAPFYIVLNANHPFFGKESIFTTSRTSQYFIQRPGLDQPYVRAAAGRNRFGVSGSFDDWYYPFQRRATVTETFVANPSAKYNVRLPATITCLHCDASRIAALQKAGYRKNLRASGTSSGEKDGQPITVEVWE